MQPSHLTLASLLAFMAAVYGISVPTPEAIGTADCFNQKIVPMLDHLGQASAYVCSVNQLSGSALPDSYSPFGVQHGVPYVSNTELSFYQLFYATPGGGYCAVARNTTDSTGQSLYGYVTTEGSGRLLQYTVDLSTGEIDTLVANISYDPTLRAWYQSSVSADGLYVTSTPYAFTTTGLGITAAQKCNRGASFEIVGGAAAQVSVLSEQALTASACSLFDSTSSVAYIVNTAGELVGQNDLALSSVELAVNSTTPLVRASAKWAADQNFAEGEVASGVFTSSDTLYEYYSRPISTVDEWGWTMVVVRPASSSSSAAVQRSSWLL